MAELAVIRAFDALHQIGLVETKRQFSLRYLGRASGYLTDLERRGCARTPMRAVAHLRARLLAIAGKVPLGIRSKIDSVVARLDSDVNVTRSLER